jgi:hypothetical protein
LENYKDIQKQKLKLRQAHNKMLEIMDSLMDTFDVAKDEALFREFGNEFYIDDDDYYQSMIS